MRTFHIQLVCLCGLFLLACASLSNCKRPGPGEKKENAEIAAKVNNAGPAPNEERVSEEESGKGVEVEGKVEDKDKDKGKVEDKVEDKGKAEDKAGKPQSGKKPAGKKEKAPKAAPPAPAKVATSKEEKKARQTQDEVEKPEPHGPSKPLPTPEENETGQTTAVSSPPGGNEQQPEEETVGNDGPLDTTQVPPEMEEEAPSADNGSGEEPASPGETEPADGANTASAGTTAPATPPDEGQAGGAAGEAATPEAGANLKALPDIQPMSCSDQGLSFDDFILAAAKNFEKQKIAYNSIPLSDCSGMFHRLVLAVKDFCPAYQYPESEEARDTRSLARWYHDNNNLVIIQKEEAATSGHLIRPGSVMFFGSSNVSYTNITIDKLAVQGGIEHMGTVVDVEKDGAGNVIGYTMFHGRNPRHPAGTTKHKLKNVSFSRGVLPPFGNWDQQWVAVANIATQ